MTGEEFYKSLRALVRDDTRGYAIDETIFSDAEIEQIAGESRLRLYTMLVKMGKLLTVNRLLKLTTATTGTNVPNDFWKLEVGRDTNGYWVLPETFKLSEGMVTEGMSVVYVRRGVFKGTAATAWYWSKPAQDIQKSFTAFTEFPDTFYYAVILQTAIELLKKELAGGEGSIKSLQQSLANQIQLLA